MTVKRDIQNMKEGNRKKLKESERAKEKESLRKKNSQEYLIIKLALKRENMRLTVPVFLYNFWAASFSESTSKYTCF